MKILGKTHDGYNGALTGVVAELSSNELKMISLLAKTPEGLSQKEVAGWNEVEVNDIHYCCQRFLETKRKVKAALSAIKEAGEALEKAETDFEAMQQKAKIELEKLKAKKTNE